MKVENLNCGQVFSFFICDSYMAEIWIYILFLTPMSLFTKRLCYTVCERNIKSLAEKYEFIYIPPVNCSILLFVNKDVARKLKFVNPYIFAAWSKSDHSV